MTIGITGAKGFIGRYLAKGLEAAKLGAIEGFAERIENHHAFREFILRHEIIIHLAGVNRAGADEEVVRGNVLQMHQLILGARGGGKWLLFASTRQQGTPYAWAKRICEDMLEEGATNGDFAATVLKLPNIYGPGCRPNYNSVVATFSSLIAQGKSLQDLPIHGDGSARREYLFVGELVRFLVGLIKATRPNGFQRHVINGQEYSVREIAEILTSEEKLPHHPYFQQTLMSYKAVTP